MSGSSIKPTTVSAAVTDAITAANTKTQTEAPAMAIGNLYQGVGQPFGHPQQQANVLPDTGTTSEHKRQGSHSQ